MKGVKMTDVIETNPAPAGDSTPKPYYDGWGLSEDSVGFLQTLQYKDANALVEGLKQTRSYVGVDKNDLIRIPKPDKDGNVNYDEVYKQLGRPDDATGYGFGDNDFAKAAAQKLFDLGITKKQAESLMEFMTEQDNANKAKADEEWNTNVEKGIAALKKEWGSDYEANIAVMQQAMRDVVDKTGFTQDDLDNIEKTLGTDKATKLFFAIGSAQGGVKNLQNYNAGQETTEIAAYKLKEMLADKETAKLLAQNDAKTMKEIKRLTELQMKGN
jgi:hypothetical protein